MGAFMKGAGGGISQELEDKIRDISAKVDRLINKLEDDNRVQTIYKGDFALMRKSNLVWWTKVDGAARYCLNLFINNEEVGSIDLDREKRYYVFDKMPSGINYLVNVVAEDRNGDAIVSASIEL